MQMEAGLDTGPVLLRAPTDISAGDTAQTLHDRLSLMGRDLILEALARLDDLTSEAQPDAGVTYAQKIDKAEARINWAQPAELVDRQIRGLSPFPGAWTTLAGKRLKLLRSGVASGEGAPGEVLAGLRIACGSGAVEVSELQPEGRARQDAQAFLNGTEIPPGTLLGGT